MTPEDLRQLRESHGMTQTEFAKFFKVHHNTWAQWERGERQMPAISVTAIEMFQFMHRKRVLADWMLEC